MTGSDVTFTRGQRIVVSAVVWLLVGPLIIGFTLMIWWMGLALFAMAAWTTYDYVRKGDMAGHITEGMSQMGKVAKGGEIVLKGEEGADDGLD